MQSINFCFNLSKFITIFIFLIFMLSEIGFIFNISINHLYIFISFVISSIFLRDEDKNALFISFLIISIIVLVLSLNFWDYSYDGRWYHQQAVIAMKDGWNPIYDNTFDSPIHKEMFWEKYYPKFCEIVSANFLLLFQKVEAGKMLNCYLLVDLFSFSLYMLSKFKKLSFWQNLIISFLVCFNPVLIVQIFTFYNDYAVYILFTMLVFLILVLRENPSGDSKTLFVMSLVMLSATKTIGLIYVPVFLILYFLCCKPKKSIKLVLVVLSLMLTTMINPYFTNLKQGHHLFHPLAGKEKIDIMFDEEPIPYHYCGYLGKTLHGIFGATSNMCGNYFDYNEYRKKIPFSVINQEKYCCCDMRIGGFGYFWSGILILTFILWFLNRNFIRESNEKIIILFVLLTVFLNPENWWARYVPQFWLVPLLVSVLLLNLQKQKSFIYIILFLIFINSAIVAFQNFSILKTYKNELNEIFKENNTLYIYDKLSAKPFKYTFLEQLKERKIKYVIVDEVFYEKNKEKFIKNLYDDEGFKWMFYEN